MGSSNRRKKRREAEKLARLAAPSIPEPIIESAPAILRLVRSEDADIPREQVSPGRPGETIGTLREPFRSNGHDHETAGGYNLDTGIDPGSDDIASLVTRSLNATEANRIFNDPSVFPLVTIPGIEKLDVTELVANDANVLLMAEGGCILFILDDFTIYEVHTAFLANARGRNALKASLAAYRWMFTHTDCMTLLTKVPAINPAAESFCKLVGATKEFERKAVWPTDHGHVDMSFWSMHYDDWMRQTPSLKKSGREFHARLEAEFQRHGYVDEKHADEDCHDLHVGACAETIFAGHVEKAVILYNRWARFAGYGTIMLVSSTPLLLNIGNALLQITGDTFKVIKVN